ncbi:ATP-binding SpoIIE family protein phosphatase [Streptomyces muensis]|uniref:SpoIIE family protein phosphatase n=1 Tax=Streptomyces muensis TaxID=1077944 RepID=A0A9X1TIR3_STRM4|nr:SpoIIE family protein phosphatase [Streptomyces muensis]MCF1592527.1 SpoIIE family protein phosphatase [Streptomyces muensis]
MNASGDPDESFSLGAMATALIDSDGIVLRWSRGAKELLGHTSAEICGQPVGRLLAVEQDRHVTRCESGVPERGRVVLRHRSGGTVEVSFHTLPLEDCTDVLLVAAPARDVTHWEQGASFLHSLLAQDQISVRIHDTDLSVVRTNLASDNPGGPFRTAGGRPHEDLAAEYARDAEEALRQVLRTGEPVLNREQLLRPPYISGRTSSVPLTAFRLEDALGHPTGVAVVFTNATEPQRARARLDLRQAAALRIGGSLDVTRTAQDLVDVLVPGLGDMAWVDIAEAVLEGEEATKLLGGGQMHMRRAAVASAVGPWPDSMLQPGEAMPPWEDSPELRQFQKGQTFLAADRATVLTADKRFGHPLAYPEGLHSVVAAPLIARRALLGLVGVWRTEQPDPFEPEDADLLAEIASRAALSLDNARRYTREHRAAVALQQRLLPRATSDTATAETAGFYRPAGGGAEISGDWYDVLPLPSLRVALVVGDVFGHGLAATATMGRLRTAVHTLADLELDPTELVTHLDDLMQQLADEVPPAQRDAVGATCLYTVYDPVTRRCSLASAGHCPPVVVQPHGPARAIGISPGPPLGVGGMPFETTTIDLPPGSVLALYTDGLITRDDQDLEATTHHLAYRLSELCRNHGDLIDIGRALMADLGEAPPSDDVALLLVRTRAIPPEHTATWEFAADPAVVSNARKAATRQLTVWGLEQLAFTTELIVSELVTNAIRHAGGPVGLRLIRDHVLVCEVTDPSNTQPRLRRARTTDEGGRGLFLIAQLSARWGSRYGLSGKTIWTEQSLTAPTTSPDT